MGVFMRPLAGLGCATCGMADLGEIDNAMWGRLVTTDTDGIPWSPSEILDKGLSYFSKYAAAKFALAANVDRLNKRDAINLVAYLLKVPSVPEYVNAAWAKLPANAKTVLYGVVQDEGAKVPIVNGPWVAEAIAAWKAAHPGAGGGTNPDNLRDDYRSQECDLLRVDFLGLCWGKKGANSTAWKVAAGVLGITALGVLGWRLTSKPSVLVVNGSGAAK